MLRVAHGKVKHIANANGKELHQCPECGAYFSGEICPKCKTSIVKKGKADDSSRSD